jgi:membrane protein implicated in regulation of membrane protease activity
MFEQILSFFPEAMDATERSYWLLSMGVTIVFLIQMVLTFVGMDFDGDTDLDFDASGFHLFTLKSLVNFLLGYGWTCALLYTSVSSLWLLNLMGIAVGCFLVYIIFAIMRFVMRFDEDGTFHLKDAVGAVGDIYLRVPEQRSGTGKIQFSKNGTTYEYDAVTDDHIPLATGDKARIIEVVGNSLVVVERVI